MAMTRKTIRLIATGLGRAGIAVGAVVLLTRGPSAATPRFFDDDPIAREEDPMDASAVRMREIRLSWDLMAPLLGARGEAGNRRAMDINTIEEVPDSNWFTNRAGSRPLTEADVARGPDTTAGPAAGVWRVVAGKSEGIRPGFTIVDTAGIRWFLKFDVPGHPETSTGAEVVVTKLFWAFGYNVAEDHVATLWPKDLVVAPDAMITGANGKRRRLTTGDVRTVLARVERSPDGSYRALASKALEGRSVGGFLYYGTRSDDPNDVVPHEDRRELRAMGVIAAWLDRVDAKANNTLDTLVNEQGRMVVRHHVLDFGSTLGAAGMGVLDYWEGHQYLYERSSLFKKLPGFGFPIEAWRTIRYPELRGVGRFEGDRFDPEKWKSRVPNPAYVRARPDDTFWAARKVMAITDGMIAAAVRSGKYSEPATERYLIQTLIKRRDAIGRAYLTRITPVVAPSLDSSGVLTFENAAALIARIPPPASYRAAWFLFDNATGDTTPIGNATESSEPVMRAPGALPQAVGSFVRVDISASSGSYPAWGVPVHASFRRTADGWMLAGLERLPDAPSIAGRATVKKSS